MKHTALDAARAASIKGPVVIGRAGAGLGSGQDTSWAANDAAVTYGRVGEERTADLLWRKLGSGVVVMHDLYLPGYRANIDHLVVSGNTVTIIDSKMWSAGFYWTVRGRTFRGATRFKPAEKNSVGEMRKRLVNVLDRAGVEHRMAEPVVVVWSRGAALWAAKFPEANLMSSRSLARRASRICGSTPADQSIVEALRPFVGN